MSYLAAVATISPMSGGSLAGGGGVGASAGGRDHACTSRIRRLSNKEESGLDGSDHERVRDVPPTKHERSRRRKVTRPPTQKVSSPGCNGRDRRSRQEGAIAMTAASPAAMNSRAVDQAKVHDALGQLDALANGALQKTGAPGLAITVVCQDQVVYLKGFGVREAGKPELIDADTVFQLASLSKPIASTVVSAVVADGLVEWDDPIIKHLPDFQLSDRFVTHQVTLRDMLCHRSGLPGELAGGPLKEAGFDRETILNRLQYLPVANHFRSHYEYCNAGITIGALAAAKAAGKPWDVLSQERLYKPLGMATTSSLYADFARATNRAPGHVPVNGKWEVRYKQDADVFSPAGGVSSTVRDMAQWLRLQLGNGRIDGRTIIKPDALSETHRPNIVRAAHNPCAHGTEFYGLAWIISYTPGGLIQLNHSGDFSTGASTAVYLLPSEGLGIAVLTSMLPRGVPESIALSFLDLVLYGNVSRDYQAELEKVMLPFWTPSDTYSKPPAQKFAAMPASNYAGTYHNNYVGDVIIEDKGGQLILLVGPQRMVYPLRHYNRDLFTLQADDAGAIFSSAVTFAVGADGEATSVLIDKFDVPGLGPLMRRAGGSA
jgi:CubicO group peptidase (beta-lactamase class C family)